MTDKHLTAEYQRDVSDFVDREVIYCVSTLIHNLLNTDNYGGVDEDEIFAVTQSAPDWESPAIEDGWEEKETEKGGTFFYHKDSDTIATKLNYLCSGYIEEYCDDWQELCESQGLDPYYDEVYEHWIVTDWLAARLAERGECVSNDIHGLTVWGRTCTGQTISLDGVITSIYDELYKDKED
mgnify:CR=1 FL=1|tara:strand:+ start:1719 stop:2261 length:543 start_codon:yes stop_codon:yes gene_type:complete